MEVVLGPGDLLILPRGTIHEGRSLPDTHSLHITLSANQGCSWAALLQAALPGALQEAAQRTLALRRPMGPDFRRLGCHTALGWYASASYSHRAASHIQGAGPGWVACRGAVPARPPAWTGPCPLSCPPPALHLSVVPDPEPPVAGSTGRTAAPPHGVRAAPPCPCRLQGSGSCPASWSAACAGCSSTSPTRCGPTSTLRPRSSGRGSWRSGSRSTRHSPDPVRGGWAGVRTGRALGRPEHAAILLRCCVEEGGLLPLLPTVQGVAAVLQGPCSAPWQQHRTQPSAARSPSRPSGRGILVSRAVRSVGERSP